MTPHSAAEIDRITRCALCKIDLKGRFVFIDDRTETLLGYSKEELFGKTFREFLAESDHEIINHVMRQQRTYETSFDSIPVTLITRSGQSLPATVIVTLGFIAGNPVNFQIIIQTDRVQRVAVATNDSSPAYHRFFTTVLAMNGSLSLADVLEPLREFLDAQAVGLYKVHDRKLELQSSAPRDTQALAVIDLQRIPKLLDRLSNLMAEPGLSSDELQRGVVESAGDNLAEYFAEFELSGQKYLLRAVFVPGSADESDLVGQRATLALKLVTRLLKAHEPQADIVISENDFAIGLVLFDTLGTGALYVGADGSIAGANHALVKLCAGYRPEGRIEDVISHLSGWGCADAARNLASFFDSAVANPPLSWKETVTFPSGTAAQITALRHSVSQSDGSAWLLVSPLRHVDAPVAAIDPTIAGSAVAEILASLNAANSVTDRLTHEFYDELHRDGNLYLSLLNGHMDKIRGMVSEFGHLIAAWTAPEEPTFCDLNLVVAGAVQEFSSSYPEVVVNCKFCGLPKLHTHRNRITRVIRNLMSNSVKYARGGKVDIQLSSRTGHGKCELVIADNGPGIPAKYLEKIFSLYYRVPLHPWQKLPGDGSSLAITRHLVRALGGNLILTSDEGSGTTAIIELPQSVISEPKSPSK